MEDWHVFATVVEHNSLNKAAQVLDISQPALSKKISKLEEQLGIFLFMRVGRKLELTRLGRIYYEYAVKMRHLNNELLQEITDYKSTGKGSLTIGASLTTLQSTLPELLTLYTEHSPDTEIKAVTGKTHEIVSLVKEKKVDVGLIASVINHPELNCVPLFDDHLCLVLPSQHEYASRTHLHLNDLNQLPMILFSEGSWYRILMNELFHRYAVFPDVRMEIDSFEAIIRLVSTCKVATLLPQSYVRGMILDNNNLIMRQMEELEQTARTTSLIYGDVESLNATAKLLIDKAKHYYSVNLLSPL